jgi:hypothetical protein
MTPRIFLDSGAFTAARQGQIIDLGEYTRFIRAHHDILAQFVNLDLIPDSGMDRDQIESAAEQSYANQQFLKDAGFSPLPVVHRLDGPGWLEKYLVDREPYIALAPGRKAGAVGWLQRCFQTIAQASYQPKIHGLGVTTATQMTVFSFSTVDSATWIKQGGYGHLLIPLFNRADEPLYNLRAKGVFVSDRMQIEPSHIDRLHDYQRDDVERFLRLCGLSLSEVRADHRARCRALIKYFQGLQSASGATLYFVSNRSADTRDLLTSCGAYDHLLSYAMFRGKREGALARYVEGHT